MVEGLRVPGTDGGDTGLIRLPNIADKVIQRVPDNSDTKPHGSSSGTDMKGHSSWYALIRNT